MSLDDTKRLNELRIRVSELTLKQRQVLSILAAEPEKWFTRKELAHRLGRWDLKLQRHDIETLNKLEVDWWIDAMKQRVIDGLEERGLMKRRDVGQRDVGLVGMYWQYQVGRHVAADLLRLMDEPAPRPERQRQDYQPPIKVIYSSPLARLRDKLGL
jgi:hypothetical protein